MLYAITSDIFFEMLCHACCDGSTSESVQTEEVEKAVPIQRAFKYHCTASCCLIDV